MSTLKGCWYHRCTMVLAHSVLLLRRVLGILCPLPPSYPCLLDPSPNFSLVQWKLGRDIWGPDRVKEYLLGVFCRDELAGTGQDVRMSPDPKGPLFCLLLSGYPGQHELD